MLGAEGWVLGPLQGPASPMLEPSPDPGSLGGSGGDLADGSSGDPLWRPLIHPACDGGVQARTHAQCSLGPSVSHREARIRPELSCTSGARVYYNGPCAGKG